MHGRLGIGGRKWCWREVEKSGLGVGCCVDGFFGGRPALVCEPGLRRASIDIQGSLGCIVFASGEWATASLEVGHGGKRGRTKGVSV